ncbi:hypothetical protein Q766_15665 [Flavobacterium subsaxonicum WB 4.1-42 = DSM 21790]|uniref:Uncharacterized protein n=1 Tax=Flavobacterium subsaxonicum WB 4.1-42 = DSM 21790 TaxID=1121898 RepID=A0A0A2MK56_9FLAO|nr:hypothetical protein Q766_15665 [Flavobacterium subsaxonicum WB 4.1-42 = DSM 21790]
MLTLYYTIWIDCIVKIRNFDDYAWKLKSMMIMSFTMAIAYMVFITILENIIGSSFYELNLKNYIAKPWCDLFESLLLFFIPFVVINYFLIFYKNRYEILIERYKYNNGKYVITFFLCCMALPLLCFLLIIIRNLL